MARRTKEQKRLDDLITKLTSKSLAGYRIDVMKIHLLTDAGNAAAADGKSDAEIEAAIIEARNQHAEAA